MQGLKGAFAIAAILGITAALGACQKAMDPMKLGSADVVIEQSSK